MRTLNVSIAIVDCPSPYLTIGNNISINEVEKTLAERLTLVWNNQGQYAIVPQTTLENTLTTFKDAERIRHLPDSSRAAGVIRWDQAQPLYTGKLFLDFLLTASQVIEKPSP